MLLVREMNRNSKILKLKDPSISFIIPIDVSVAIMIAHSLLKDLVTPLMRLNKSMEFISKKI